MRFIDRSVAAYFFGPTCISGYSAPQSQLGWLDLSYSLTLPPPVTITDDWCFVGVRLGTREAIMILATSDVYGVSCELLLCIDC